MGNDYREAQIGTVTYNFQGANGGTYTFVSADGGTTLSGSITSYSYTPDGYGGQLLVQTDQFIPVRFRLGQDSFNAAENKISGRHTGTIYFWNSSYAQYFPAPGKGTFTLTR